MHKRTNREQDSCVGIWHSSPNTDSRSLEMTEVSVLLDSESHVYILTTGGNRQCSSSTFYCAGGECIRQSAVLLPYPRNLLWLVPHCAPWAWGKPYLYLPRTTPKPQHTSNKAGCHWWSSISTWPLQAPSPEISARQIKAIKETLRGFVSKLLDRTKLLE